MSYISDTMLQQVLDQYKGTIEIDRKMEVQNRLAMYQDDYLDQIEQQIKDWFYNDNYLRMKVQADDSINVVEYVVNEICKSYSQESGRYALVSEEQDAVYERLLEQIPMDIIMDKVQKYTYVCNECLIGVMWRDGLELDIITPDRVTIIQDEDHPTKPKAIIYEINLVDTIQGAVNLRTGKNTLRYYIYWDTEGKHFRFDSHMNIVKRDDNPENVNPYKDAQGNFILPFVICHKEYNDESVWNRTSGNKLFSAQKQVAVFSTLFSYYVKSQSFKQLYITGKTDADFKDEQILDPLTVIKAIGDGVNVGVLDLQNNLQAFNDILDRKIERTLNQEGLALEQFKHTGSPESGYSIKVKQRALDERREALQKFFRIYEGQLFNIMRIVYNYHAADKINETAEFSIDFADIDVQQSPLEWQQEKTFNITNNLENYIDVLQQMNPDYDEAQAAAAYAKNKQINRDYTPSPRISEAMAGVGEALGPVEGVTE